MFTTMMVHINIQAITYMWNNILDKSSNAVNKWSINNRTRQHCFADHTFGRFTRRICWHFINVNVLARLCEVRTKDEDIVLKSYKYTYWLVCNIKEYYKQKAQTLKFKSRQKNRKSENVQRNFAISYVETFYIFKTKHNFIAIAK